MKYIGFVLMVLGGVVVAIWQPFGGEGSGALPRRDAFLVGSEQSSGDPRTVSATVSVSIGGAVLKPGMYEVTLGTRVAELVTLAGGFLPGANTTRVKLAGILKEGEHIAVPGQSMRLSPSPSRRERKGPPHAKTRENKRGETRWLSPVIQAGLNGGDAGYLRTHWRLSPADITCIMTHRRISAIRDESSLRQAGLSSAGIRRILAIREVGW